MSNVINKTLGFESVKNLGIGKAFLEPKEIIGYFLVPLTKSFTEAELDDDTIATTIGDLIKASLNQRVYPFMHCIGFTDGSEDPVSQTFGFGGSGVVREGMYKWTTDYRKGGVELNNALRSFNEKESIYGAIFVDGKNTLLGTMKHDEDGNNLLSPIPLEKLYTFPWKANDGKNLAAYKTQFEFEAVYVNEKIAFRKVNPSTYLFKDVVGLIDLLLEFGTTDITGTTVSVKVFDAGGVDMYDYYKTELADTTCFALKNATTGGAITLTSVGTNDTTKEFLITIPTSGNSNYPSATGKYTIALGSISDLEAQAITGYEGVNTLVATRPA